MTNERLADQQTTWTDVPNAIKRSTVLKWFLVIAAIAFILRIFYVGHLYEDDGLWFTAGEEIARGKALYREIYFDKPPLLPLVYGLLFSLFGAHILVIRLFTIVYTIGISAVLYLFGARLYDQRVGLVSAAMFAAFSTSHSLGHIQSLNTDCLMTLPYASAAFLMVFSQTESASTTRRQVLLALSAGALTGVAFETNPKALFDLIFFAVLLIASSAWSRKESESADVNPSNRASRWTLFAAASAGFVLVSLVFLAYIAATRSFSAYWSDLWRWGTRYARFYSPGTVAAAAIRFTSGYFVLNDILLITLLFVIVTTIKRVRPVLFGTKTAQTSAGVDERALKSDITVLIWLIASYAGVAVGGRFYSHYFFQILPALCLIGGRGLLGIISALKTRSTFMRRVVFTALSIGFLFTLVRFHGRGLLLALDWARSHGTLNIGWYHEVRNREERTIAALVRDLPDPADAAERLPLEAIRSGGPRWRQADGPTDYLFIWGYRPEIYFWSGLLPASRYLSAQPLTGVPADVQYTNGEHRAVIDEASTAAARAQLISDLTETQPKYIIDELGFFNSDLAILQYPELEKFMESYKPLGPTERFLVYVRRSLTHKHASHDSTRP